MSCWGAQAANMNALSPQKLLPVSDSGAAASVSQTEEHRLRNALHQKRQEIANMIQQPPVNICGDILLEEMSRSRPGSLELLAKCEGAHKRFCETFGNAFVELVKAFCKESAVLNLGGWVAKRHMDPDAVSSWADRRKLAPVDPGMEEILDKIFNGEPGQAAMDALDRFTSGESVEDIAVKGRMKPIQVSTVLGYLSHAMCVRDIDDGTWGKLAAECDLDAKRAQAVRQAIGAHGSLGMKAVKGALPEECTYAQIKAVGAAIKAHREHLLGIKAGVGGRSSAAGVPPPAAGTASAPPSELDDMMVMLLDDSEADGGAPLATLAGTKRPIETGKENSDNGAALDGRCTAPPKILKAAPGRGFRAKMTSPAWKTKRF